MDLFPDTKWTILAEATLHGDQAAMNSLSAICLKYKSPVDKIIRLKGVPAERVEDVRQDFFIELMTGSFFKKASKDHGKFRTFLLKALQDFLVDDIRKISAQKRGGNLERVDIDENMESSSTQIMEFDAVWAETIFDNAMQSIREEVCKKRGGKAWLTLEHFLTFSENKPDYNALAEVLEIGVGGAKAEVSRMRKKFREELRAEVSKTVDSPHEIDEELRYLKETMMHLWGGESG